MRIKIKNILTIVSIGFLFVTQLGLFTEADAGIYAIAISLLKPSWSPFLLLQIATIQDAPGLAYKWHYFSFAIISCIFLLSFYLKIITSYRNPLISKDLKPLVTVGFFSSLVICYGLLTSLLYNNSIFSQSADRPFYFVAPLMLIMTITAIVSVITLVHKEGYFIHLAFIAKLSILNSIFVAIMQLFRGQEFGRSSSGLEAVLEAAQLTEPSALGIPRIPGTFLTPNALALGVALLLMIVLRVKKSSEIGVSLSAAYLAVGLTVSLLSLSKAMLAYYLITFLILLFFATNTTFIIACCSTLVMTLIIIPVDWESILMAYRFTEQNDLGYRGLAWSLILHKFSISEWIFGTGLSYWPSFFLNNLGFSLSDPHSYIFSVPGTFGIIGVIFYVYLAVSLSQILIVSESKNRILALFLIILIFGKDLVSIPYIFGNTPITYLAWLCISILFVKGLTDKQSQKLTIA